MAKRKTTYYHISDRKKDDKYIYHTTASCRYLDKAFSRGAVEEIRAFAPEQEGGSIFVGQTQHNIGTEFFACRECGH